MEKESLKKIKGILLAEKERIERELESIAKKKGKKFDPFYPEYGKRDEENAAEIEEYELHLALDKNLEKLLSEVIKALARVELGSYGLCESCSREIAVERLEAFPSASFCIECQAKNENPIKKFFAKFKPNKESKTKVEKVKKPKKPKKFFGKRKSKLKS